MLSVRKETGEFWLAWEPEKLTIHSQQEEQTEGYWSEYSKWVSVAEWFRQWDWARATASVVSGIMKEREHRSCRVSLPFNVTAPKHFWAKLPFVFSSLRPKAETGSALSDVVWQPPSEGFVALTPFSVSVTICSSWNMDLFSQEFVYLYCLDRDLLPFLECGFSDACSIMNAMIGNVKNATCPACLLLIGFSC